MKLITLTKVMLLGSLLGSTVAVAQTEKSKRVTDRNQRRALATTENNEMMEAPPSDTEAPVERRRSDHGEVRHHFIGAALKSISSKVEGSRSEEKLTDINVSYLWDFGYFGLGPSVGIYQWIPDSDSSYESASVGFTMKFNFVKNAVGHNFIPHIMLTLGAESDQDKSAKKATSSTSAITSLRVGLDIYPLSRYIALTPSLESTQRKAEDGTKTTISGLTMGFSLSF